MKKYSFYRLFILLLFLFIAYKTIHIYQDATCTTSEYCVICHKIKSPALGHDFSEVTCTEDSICSRCHEVNQVALGHDFINLTSEFSICDRCHETNGTLDNISSDKSNNYLVYNLTYDYSLYEKNIYDKVNIASLTKLLTVCVALDYLDINDKLTIGDEIKLIKPNSSTAHLEKGQIFTVYELIEACLIPSGNDAAYVLAINTINKIYPNIYNLEESVIKFAELMNSYATNLGCINSHFVCPDGYDTDDHYSCCYDLLLISKKIYSYDFIKEIVKQKQTEISSNKHTIILRNSNNLLYENQSPYYNYITGLKTGYTGKAKRCIIITTNHNDIENIIICLGCETIEDRTDFINYFLDTLIIN